MKWMLTNSAGEKDSMLTFAAISFAVVTLNILLATFESITIGGNVIHFQPLDGGIMAVYLGATFTAYVSRRLTDTHYYSGITTNTTTNISTTETTSK